METPQSPSVPDRDPIDSTEIIEEVVEDTEFDADIAARNVIPGDETEIAEDTAELGPEGRPGDPKVGPRAIRAEILVGFVIVGLFAAGLAYWLGIIAGSLAFVLGMLALLLNPVVGAASQRAVDREEVLARHLHDEIIVVKDTVRPPTSSIR